MSGGEYKEEEEEEEDEDEDNVGCDVDDELLECNDAGN